MENRVLPGKALQGVAYLLLAVALLAQDWTPLLLLVLIALFGEWRSRRSTRAMASIAEGRS